MHASFWNHEPSIVNVWPLVGGSFHRDPSIPFPLACMRRKVRTAAKRKDKAGCDYDSHYHPVQLVINAHHSSCYQNHWRAHWSLVFDTSTSKSKVFVSSVSSMRFWICRPGSAYPRKFRGYACHLRSDVAKHVGIPIIFSVSHTPRFVSIRLPLACHLRSDVVQTTPSASPRRSVRLTCHQGSGPPSSAPP